MSLPTVTIRNVRVAEEKIFQQLMQKHHYLGALPKIANTIWYVAVHEEEWSALLSFSAPALKCGARDQWIGWNYRHQYDRLHLIANNSRFLIFQEWNRLFFEKKSGEIPR